MCEKKSKTSSMENVNLWDKKVDVTDDFLGLTALKGKVKLDATKNDPKSPVAKRGECFDVRLDKKSLETVIG